MATMNIENVNALVATLARIDQQIVTCDALLVNPHSGGERIRLSDEVTYLRTERRIVAAKLKKKP
jgi:hypothetical protein